MPGTFFRNSISPPFVTGSLSAKAQRKGFSKLSKNSQVLLLFEPRRRRQCGNLTGHRPRPHLVARVREGSLVGDRNGRWQGRRHAKLVQQQLEQLHGQCRRRKHHGHHKTYRQIDGLPAPLLPIGEFIAGEHSRIPLIAFCICGRLGVGASARKASTAATTSCGTSGLYGSPASWR